MMGVQRLEIAGQQMAILPMADYQRLVEIAEDRADIVAAIAAEQRRNEGAVEYLPSSMVNQILDGENALMVWREYRGYSVNHLSEKSGFGPSMIRKVESGSRQGTFPFWKAMALALDVLPEDIMPIE
jgi:ribosome-binding protein aMBF1 (putative translation factor)